MQTFSLLGFLTVCQFEVRLFKAKSCGKVTLNLERLLYHFEEHGWSQCTGARARGPISSWTHHQNWWNRLSGDSFFCNLQILSKDELAFVTNCGDELLRMAATNPIRVGYEFRLVFYVLSPLSLESWKTEGLSTPEIDIPPRIEQTNCCWNTWQVLHPI